MLLGGPWLCARCEVASVYDRELFGIVAALLANFLKQESQIIRDMDSVPSDIEVMNKIKAAAPAEGVDLSDPKNAYMVWMVQPKDDVHVQYCGSCATLQEANLLASQHVNLPLLYIVRANPPAIMKFHKT